MDAVGRGCSRWQIHAMSWVLAPVHLLQSRPSMVLVPISVVSMPGAPARFGCGDGPLESGDRRCFGPSELTVRGCRCCQMLGDGCEGGGRLRSSRLGRGQQGEYGVERGRCREEEVTQAKDGSICAICHDLAAPLTSRGSSRSWIRFFSTVVLYELAVGRCLPPHGAVSRTPNPTNDDIAVSSRNYRTLRWSVLPRGPHSQAHGARARRHGGEGRTPRTCT